MQLPLKPNQQETGPESELKAEDLVHWVAVLPELEPVYFPVTNRSWRVEAESEPARVGDPVSSQGLIAPTGSVTEMATAYRTRLHRVSGVAPVWWALAMPSF